jgi:hypothetical protein
MVSSFGWIVIPRIILTRGVFEFNLKGKGCKEGLGEESPCPAPISQ